MKTIFRFNDDEYLFEVKLIVWYVNMEGDEVEKYLPFRTGEELHSHMENIFTKNWHELFKEKDLDVEKDLKNGIISCSIKGIRVTGSNDEGYLNLLITDLFGQAKIAIDEEVLKDKNAKKIKKILKIITR